MILADTPIIIVFDSVYWYLLEWLENTAQEFFESIYIKNLYCLCFESAAVVIKIWTFRLALSTVLYIFRYPKYCREQWLIMICCRSLQDFSVNALFELDGLVSFWSQTNYLTMNIGQLDPYRKSSITGLVNWWVWDKMSYREDEYSSWNCILMVELLRDQLFYFLPNLELGFN